MKIRWLTPVVSVAMLSLGMGVAMAADVATSPVDDSDSHTCDQELGAIDEDTDSAAEQAAKLAHQSYYAAVAEQLIRTEQPRALLLAARLLHWTQDQAQGDGAMLAGDAGLAPRQAELARAAALRAGDDMLVWWPLANGAFHEMAPELKVMAITELRRLQPDNLAVWLLENGDSSLDDQQLAHAAASQAHDLAYLARAQSDVALLSEYPVPDSLRAFGSIDDSMMSDTEYHMTFSFGVLMAEAMPAMSNLFDMCRVTGPMWKASHRLPCERIATVLTGHSDTLIGTVFGQGIRRVMATTEAEKQAVEQAKRTYAYQMEASGWTMETPESRRQKLAWMLEPGATEMSVTRKALAAVDAPLTPPSQWRMPEVRTVLSTGCDPRP